MAPAPTEPRVALREQLRHAVAQEADDVGVPGAVLLHLGGGNHAVLVRNQEDSVDALQEIRWHVLDVQGARARQRARRAEEEVSARGS